MARPPKQERSRLTVDSIIEAGFICVAKHGVAGTTTRHIADIAGIGVGTLYEYFDHKEDIFRHMNQYLLADILKLIQQVKPQILPLKIEDGTRILMDRFQLLLTQNNERYLKVAKEVLHADMEEYIEPVRKILSELVLQYLMNHPEYLRLPHLQAMSYVVINAGILLILQHLSSPNPPISYTELTDGLAHLVQVYAGQINA